MLLKIKTATTAALLLAFVIISSCHRSSSDQMRDILKEVYQKNNASANPFDSEATLAHIDSLLQKPGNQHNIRLLLKKASLALRVGKEQESVQTYNTAIKEIGNIPADNLLPDVAIAYMRLGERNNCMTNHNAYSCIFPIKDGGIHQQKTGSTKAIQIYEKILTKNPNDLESRWLLNIAFMTLGGYPKDVPPQFLLPGLDSDTGEKVKPFVDVAGSLGLDINGRAGSVIVDDFNNDGYLDIVTCGWMLDDPMHYFQNNGDGSFTDMTERSGLTGITGGSNMQQMDFNNDGNLDIFIERGGWNINQFGNQPGSLLKNNGDGTFTDVTIDAGLLFYQPSHSAVWADFNNDGYIDVYVAAENNDDAGGKHTCELYINNHDGTFTDVAKQAHVDISKYVKGVTVADYNNDGWPDIFISTMNGNKYLLKNKGKPGKIPDFEDVTAQAGLAQNKARTFTTWFFDYNNDGWPDIMVADYTFSKALAYFPAAEALGKPVPNAGNTYLFRNNHDGTFTDVTNETGLNKVVFSMGANFGDIDNDGYPDMYFGTGNPEFKSLAPNKLFKNMGGKRFADVTLSSRTGNLQKGHGVAFADFRNIGIQDIFIQMGGAYKGDAYNSCLYMNPGQNNNNWISLKLQGVKANRAAIGSRIKLTFTENGTSRSVYKDVNSGGSFGSSPLQQEIGIGQAKVIDDIEIKWAGSQTVQHFKNVTPNQFLYITEGNNNAKVLHLKKLIYQQKQSTAMSMKM